MRCGCKGAIGDQLCCRLFCLHCCFDLKRLEKEEDVRRISDVSDIFTSTNYLSRQHTIPKVSDFSLNRTISIVTETRYTDVMYEK